MVDMPRLEWEPIDYGEKNLDEQLAQGMSLHRYVVERDSVERRRTECEHVDIERVINVARQIIEELGIFIDSQSTKLVQGEN